jgi:hypothetical protein
MKKIFTLLSLFTAVCANAQILDTLAFQDFEIVPATPTWTFTGPVIYNSGFSGPSAAPANSPLGIGGSRAWETTTNSGGLQLDFANVIIPAGYDSVRVRYNLAAMNLISTGGGPDNLDYVLTAVSTDGGVTYYNRLRIRGATTDNSYWPYSATGVAKVYYQPQTEALMQPTSSGLQTTMGYSTCEIVFPGSVTQVSLRVTGRSSSSTDTWLIDNVVITGENNCLNSASSISPVVCGTYTSPSGGVYTSSANFTDVIPNAVGCDSIISINLTVNNASASSISPVVCGTYTSPSGGVYTSSANFTDIIPNTVGCDSVISINLTVNNASASSISPVVCGTYTSPSGGVYTSSANFTDIIPNAAGCDSVISINLTVNTVDTSVTLNGATITANASGMTYQWINCSTNTQVPGAQSQSFLPSANGTYAVIVTTPNCTDTSSCVQVVSVNVNSLETNNVFSVLPNPVENRFMLNAAQPLEQAVFTLTDIRGRVVFSLANQNGSAFEIDMQRFESGMYILQVTEKDHVSNIRVVKE